MPAEKHFAAPNTAITAVATHGAGGAVVYHVNGERHPGPNHTFSFGATPGSVTQFSVAYVGDNGTTCQVRLDFGGQVDFDFLASVTGAPPDTRFHDFIAAVTAADVSRAESFRTFQLTGRVPAGRRPATKKRGNR